MNILFNIAVSLIASAVIFVGGMNIPASTFSLKSLSDPIFGAFTEITTATNLADFPTTYNANLTKSIEVGTTSVASITTLAGLTTANALTSASALATIGTITSGVWNGTVIGVAYNGTGTTSPTSNQVMLGNGSSGFKVVSGFGTSGQFLTSGGAATPPTWTTSAVNQTDSYNWTGTNFLVKNLSASSTAANPLTLNGVAYNTPSTQGASSTVLTNNGSGRLTNEILPWLNIGQTSFAGAATTTLTLTSTTTAQDIRIVVNAVQSGTACRILMQLNPNTTTGLGANYKWTLKPNNDTAATGATNDSMRIAVVDVANDGFYVTINLSNDALFRKYATWQGAVLGSATSWGGSSFDDTTNQLKSLNVGLGCTSGASTMTSGRITVYASQN